MKTLLAITKIKFSTYKNILFHKFLTVVPARKTKILFKVHYSYINTEINSFVNLLLRKVMSWNLNDELERVKKYSDLRRRLVKFNSKSMEGC